MLRTSEKRNARLVLAFAAATGLCVLTYVPAFLVVGITRSPVVLSIPIIIVTSFAVALIAVAILSLRMGGIRQFGLAPADYRHIGAALVLGVPLALVASLLTHTFPTKPPLDTSTISIALLVVYFGFGAPVQEEAIFRGLIQSFLQRRLLSLGYGSGAMLLAPLIFTSILFGLIHLEAGVLVAVFAVVLGLCAGELRRRSGSLIPAILVHMAFNVPDLVWR